MKRRELVDVIDTMRSGRLNLIEGVRRICRLRFDVGSEDDPVFFPIRSAESETDRFPIGHEREHWDAAALARMDAELASYESDLRPQILRSCEEIVKLFAD
jgi:Protein of unknown function (DUF2489)